MSDTIVATHEAADAVWPPLPPVLGDRTVVPEDARYRFVRSNYMRVGSPRLVVMAESDDEVAAAIRYAAAVREATGTPVPLSFRSGGHGLSGSSVNDGGIVLDISALNRIDIVDATSGLVRVQAGATWGDVAQALGPHDLVISSGNFGDTGVGGLATFGGIGYFIRSHGLTVDHVRGARLISADGEPRWVDDTHDPDLFWAVRGGGSQLGIVTEFLFQARSLHTPARNAAVIAQIAQYLTRDLPGFVDAWGTWIREAPREMVSFTQLHDLGSRQYAIKAFNMWSGADTTRAEPVLSASAQLGKLMRHDAYLTTYPDFIPTPRATHMGQQSIKTLDVLVDHADRTLGEAFVESFAHRTTALGELRSIGGAANDIPADATAWANRHQEAFAAVWVRPRGLELENEAFAPVRRLGTGTYGAYSSHTTPDVATLAWPGVTGGRLRRIAENVDPNRLFDQGLTLRR